MKKAYLFGGEIPAEDRVKTYEDGSRLPHEIRIGSYVYKRKPTQLLFDDCFKYECLDETDSIECPTCFGGKVTECPYCEGTGELECDDCEGQGFVAKEDVEFTIAKEEELA